MQITRLVKLSFSEDYLDTFLESFEKKKQQILSYEGCLTVDLYLDSTKKGLCFTVSTWKSEAALEAYRQSDWFQATWKEVKQHFTDKPEAWTTYSQKMLQNHMA
ncbi:MAG: putative quinol monooxygenase [Chitinophagales bacterium]